MVLALGSGPRDLLHGSMAATNAWDVLPRAGFASEAISLGEDPGSVRLRGRWQSEAFMCNGGCFG